MVLDKKTYKRELGVAILFFWCYCVLTLETATIAAITPWVFIYILGAFGVDAYAKQIKVTDKGIEVGDK